MSTGEFHTVEAGLLGPQGGVDELALHDVYFVHGHAVAGSAARQCRYVAGGPGGAEGRGVTLGTVVVELQQRAAVIFVYGLGKLLKGAYLAVVGQTELAGPGRVVFVVNRSGLNNYHSGAAAGPFGVVLDTAGAGDAVPFAI